MRMDRRVICGSQQLCCWITQPRKGQAFTDTFGPVWYNQDHYSLSLAEEANLHPPPSADGRNGARLW
ncbi:hypothetical protein BD311DRAFT_758904 [Dichomitus squalens]|uniref:Uncharacterized protein n=1 Tax=Dichomitus squalens TaxID=114155 RepID=A0A4Q9MKP6_9APHY|nr:hypothetical protein BD311DRAFT_758904 [Dichomitus squalens]